MQDEASEAGDGRTDSGAPDGMARRVAGSLTECLSTLPVTDAAAAEVARSDLMAAARTAGADGLADTLAQPGTLPDFLGAVLSQAPFLRDLAVLDPLRLAAILADDPDARVAGLVAAAGERQADEAALMRHLRRLKQDIALTVGLADLGGAWDVDRVTAALSDFADAAISAAVNHLLREADRTAKLRLANPDAPSERSGWILLSMGKGGARELNYSSDVDLIVLFDPERPALTDPDEAARLFVRMTQRLVKILQERTPDGYVFRLDLRLRPDPGATAVALSVPAALVYYESMGQNWERAALIKARACAGDIEAGEGFLAEIAPFIWRKSFDYAAIADVHSIKRQIHAVKGHGTIAVAGHNIKLGRGGIREIEFFVQTQQLIAGGREPRLRGRSTRQMLRVLHDLGWIEERVRDQLDAAYVFLRSVEHRLQVRRDEQTHVLPADRAGLETIARLMGFADLPAFEAALRVHLERVQKHYARLFEDAPALGSDTGNLVFTGGDDDPDTLDTLSQLGFKAPQEVTRAIRAWHFGRYAATRSTKARERLTEITPALLATLGRLDNADATFAAFDRFVAQLPAGVQIFSLLRSNPGLLDLIALVMGAAPRLAAIMTRRPRVLDALLDPLFFGALPKRKELAARLESFLAEARSYEEALDRARIFGQEQAFLIGVRVLTGTVECGQAGAGFATLADAIVQRLFRCVEAEFAVRHGKVPGGAAALLALGKLGGREMTAASDLDLILLYDHPEDAEASDGVKPLAPSQYYARLTQRLVAALSAPTGEGTLYEVDFRLRPSGNAGPLATRLDAFESYQVKDAWTWEHMALTRARAIAGDPGLGERAEAMIRAVLRKPRDRTALFADVASMRGRIERDKGTKDPFDLKQVPGGLIDVEFVAQALMLANGAERDDVLSTTTETALARLAEAGLLAGEEAAVLRPAIRLYQALTQVLRLAVDGRFVPAEAPGGVLAAMARAAEMPDFGGLEAHLVETQRAVRESFERVVGMVGGAPPAP
ncbi:bifunctional [glutamine synthetase] adenylyltransferase/[glutamine synthetase]-adenylyl-L-tyrosine phosphorylase [Pseudoxanthobacter sp. M-2]|uniref:bifunctional [glutamine synthetase] adenylyltransferase/[glutamine synthetase]-adenylyl-L-tyrosine phosphorylase n=1 Tax=Pseudoxanthobacter sp. M-2 TaxID=3078754 RepID=UPI0038FBE60D